MQHGRVGKGAHAVNSQQTRSSQTRRAHASPRACSSTRGHGAIESTLHVPALCQAPLPTLLFPLHIAHRRFRRDTATAARECLAPIDFPVAVYGATRIGLPIIRPVAERIAVPWRVRSDRRQSEFLPDAKRAL